MRAVDYFAGAGGFTVGATTAGVDVVACVNHWRTAVNTHESNHPNVVHHCQDAALFDPRDLPSFDMLLASPACQGHSRARGTDKPHHDADRATAWCVVNTAEVCLPRWIVVENVREFVVKWKLFPAWRNALEALEYWVSVQFLDAAAWGVPQNRVRAIVVARRGKMAPTIVAPRTTEVAARTVLDLDAGVWRDITDCVQNTQDRVAAVRARFGGLEEFLVSYYSGKWHEKRTYNGRPLDRPMPTITTKDCHAIVRGDRLRMLSVDEIRGGMGFPSSYALTGTRAEQVKQLGNAIPPPLASGVLEQVLSA